MFQRLAYLFEKRLHHVLCFALVQSHLLEQQVARSALVSVIGSPYCRSLAPLFLFQNPAQTRQRVVHFGIGQSLLSILQ
jgi:hypothetical protein